MLAAAGIQLVINDFL